MCLTPDVISLAFLISIILSICRICDTYYTRNSEIQHLLDEREELLKLELKMQEQEFQSQNTTPSPTLNNASPNGSDTPVASPQINQGEDAVTDPLAVGYINDQHSRTIAGSSPGNFSLPSSSRFAGASLAAIPEASYQAFGESEGSSSTDPTASLSPESAFLLSSTEMHANLAMVTDGSRYTPGQVVDHSQLPPYSPSNQRTMAGHSHESNDIRLSEYVKGETRAQDMKDSGGF